MKASLILFFALFLSLQNVSAQDRLENIGQVQWNYEPEEISRCALADCCERILTPDIITDTRRIRRYILDERFRILKTRDGDMRAIDAIYLKSLRIADYNISRALFISFMAVLEHRDVTLKIPILRTLKMPLTFEQDSIFSRRIRHLPTHVYADTAGHSDGDRDKLQHFFGSAYLCYVTESPDFAAVVGNIIEWGEMHFVAGGVDDVRDERANTQGAQFGWDLLGEETMLPSDYLLSHTNE